MSPNLTEQYAGRVVDRIGPIVGFIDPVSLLMLLFSVLGFLMQCWGFVNKDVPQSDLHARLVESCADQKKKAKLIKRAARLYRREAKTPITKEQSLVLGEASIEEALASPPEEVAKYAIACGKLPQSEQSYFLNQEQCDVDDDVESEED